MKSSFNPTSSSDNHSLVRFYTSDAEPLPSSIRPANGSNYRGTLIEEIDIDDVDMDEASSPDERDSLSDEDDGAGLPPSFPSLKDLEKLFRVTPGSTSRRESRIRDAASTALFGPYDTDEQFPTRVLPKSDSLSRRNRHDDPKGKEEDKGPTFTSSLSSSSSSSSSAASSSSSSSSSPSSSSSASSSSSLPIDPSTLSFIDAPFSFSDRELITIEKAQDFVAHPMEIRRRWKEAQNVLNRLFEIERTIGITNKTLNPSDLQLLKSAIKNLKTKLLSEAYALQKSLVLIEQTPDKNISDPIGIKNLQALRVRISNNLNVLRTGQTALETGSGKLEEAKKKLADSCRKDVNNLERRVLDSAERGRHADIDLENVESPETKALRKVVQELTTEYEKLSKNAQSDKLEPLLSLKVIIEQVFNPTVEIYRYLLKQPGYNETAQDKALADRLTKFQTQTESRARKEQASVTLPSILSDAQHMKNQDNLLPDGAMHFLADSAAESVIAGSSHSTGEIDQKIETALYFIENPDRIFYEWQNAQNLLNDLLYLVRITEAFDTLPKSDLRKTLKEQHKTLQKTVKQLQEILLTQSKDNEIPLVILNQISDDSIVEFIADLGKNSPEDRLITLRESISENLNRMRLGNYLTNYYKETLESTKNQLDQVLKEITDLEKTISRNPENEALYPSLNKKRKERAILRKWMSHLMSGAQKFRATLVNSKLRSKDFPLDSLAEHYNAAATAYRQLLKESDYEEHKQDKPLVKALQHFQTQLINRARAEKKPLLLDSYLSNEQCEKMGPSPIKIEDPSWGTSVRSNYGNALNTCRDVRDLGKEYARYIRQHLLEIGGNNLKVTGPFALALGVRSGAEYLAANTSALSWIPTDFAGSTLQEPVVDALTSVAGTIAPYVPGVSSVVVIAASVTAATLLTLKHYSAIKPPSTRRIAHTLPSAAKLVGGAAALGGVVTVGAVGGLHAAGIDVVTPAGTLANATYTEGASVINSVASADYSKMASDASSTLATLSTEYVVNPVSSGISTGTSFIVNTASAASSLGMDYVVTPASSGISTSTSFIANTASAAGSLGMDYVVNPVSSGISISSSFIANTASTAGSLSTDYVVKPVSSAISVASAGIELATSHPTITAAAIVGIGLTAAVATKKLDPAKVSQGAVQLKDGAIATANMIGNGIEIASLATIQQMQDTGNIVTGVYEVTTQTIAENYEATKNVASSWMESGGAAMGDLFTRGKESVAGSYEATKNVASPWIESGGAAMGDLFTRGKESVAGSYEATKDVASSWIESGRTTVGSLFNWGKSSAAPQQGNGKNARKKEARRLASQEQ